MRDIFGLKRLREDPDLRAYVQRELALRGRLVAFVSVLTGVPFHVAMIAIDRAVVAEQTARLLLWSHLGVIAILPVLLALPLARRWFPSLTAIGQGLVLLCYANAARSATVAGLTQDHDYALFLHILLGTYAIFTHPRYDLTLLLVLGNFTATFLWATAGSDKPPVWEIAFFCSVTTGATFYLVHAAGAATRARDEFVMRTRLMPRAVLRKAVHSSVPLDSLFAPRLRTCVCISSDWRNYQLLSSRLDPVELEHVLAHYYQSVQSVLHDLIPEGNYFSDWIADELFVVIYGETDEQAPLVAQALAVTVRLIRAKEGLFAFVPQAPGIDTGISVGKALVGMLGPDDHKKATALGELPGRARRLQSAGRLLRAAFGEQDRLIFDDDVARYAGEHEVQTHTLAQHETIKDLPTRTLHFVEPAADKTRTAADETSDTAA